MAVMEMRMGSLQNNILEKSILLILYTIPVALPSIYFLLSLCQRFHQTNLTLQVLVGEGKGGKQP